jgi:phosphatidylserine decarboxylase
MFHKEGYFYISVAILNGILISALAWKFVPVVFPFVLIFSIVFLVLVLQFFRNPVRTIPLLDPRLVYAPADGKVVVIEEVIEDELLKDKRIQVSIFMSPINVHVNRIPIPGRIVYAKYHPGKFLVAWHPKSSTENERTSIAIDNGNFTIMMRQIAGAVARRIKYYVKEGQDVKQGEEFGFIKFGSRVDLFLPTNAEILVNLEQKVTGNKTVIAKLPA